MNFSGSKQTVIVWPNNLNLVGIFKSFPRNTRISKHHAGVKVLHGAVPLAPGNRAMLINYISQSFGCVPDLLVLLNLALFRGMRGTAVLDLGVGVVGDWFG